MYRCICIQVHGAFRLYHLPQTRDIASNNWHSCSLLSGGVNTMNNTTILQYTCETALVWQRKTDTRSTGNSHSYSLAPAILNNFLTNAINSDIMSSSFPRSRRWHRQRWSCDLTLLRLPPPDVIAQKGNITTITMGPSWHSSHVLCIFIFRLSEKIEIGILALGNIQLYSILLWRV